MLHDSIMQEHHSTMVPNSYPVRWLALRPTPGPKPIPKAVGTIWLDEHVRDHDDNPQAQCFGSRIEQARISRQAFLRRDGILKDIGEKVDV